MGETTPRPLTAFQRAVGTVAFPPLFEEESNQFHCYGAEREKEAMGRQANVVRLLVEAGCETKLRDAPGFEQLSSDSGQATRWELLEPSIRITLEDLAQEPTERGGERGELLADMAEYHIYHDTHKVTVGLDSLVERSVDSILLCARLVHQKRATPADTPEGRRIVALASLPKAIISLVVEHAWLGAMCRHVSAMEAKAAFQEEARKKEAAAREADLEARGLTEQEAQDLEWAQNEERLMDSMHNANAALQRMMNETDHILRNVSHSKYR